MPDLGAARDGFFQPPGVFQHFRRGPAAAVAPAVGQQVVGVQLLLLVALPAAHDLPGLQHPVVGGDPQVLGLVAGGMAHVVPGGGEMSENLRAVDALPQEGVVGELVDVVPAQLGGHEIVHAALFADLWQGRRVAEHVGEPQDPAVHAELLPEKALAVEELPNQGFAGGKVAVGLYPHAAFGLPVPGRTSWRMRSKRAGWSSLTNS